MRTDTGSAPPACGGRISLAYGDRQRFRYRCEDLHFCGSTSVALPVKRSDYRLNGGPPVHFYVERKPTAADPPRYPWGTQTPAVNRLRDLPGHFNIELPADDDQLRPGDNQLSLSIQGREGERAELRTTFAWDPSPVGLPLDLTDLSHVSTLQELGQVVDGLWDMDPVRNAITTRAPVGHDALLLLGGPHGSQEATYTVIFSAPVAGVFAGLSDFFVRHDEQLLDLGIKPGYSTAGLATVSPDGFAECWMAMADNTWDKAWPWVRKSAPAHLRLRPGIPYAVRHQVLFDDRVVLSRFRIWPAAAPEPTRWLCSTHTAGLAPDLPQPTVASFGLFQYHGQPTRWSNLQVRALHARIRPEDLAPPHPLHDRLRRARFRATRVAQDAPRRLARLKARIGR